MVPPKTGLFRRLKVYMTSMGCLIVLCQGIAQVAVEGTIITTTNAPLRAVEIIALPGSQTTQSRRDGTYRLVLPESGTYQLLFLLDGYETVAVEREITAATTLDVTLEKLEVDLSEIVVEAKTEGAFGLRRLRNVEGTSIYAGKKSEVILLDRLTFNVATNNPRQIYAQIAGLNIQETNDAGLQLNIGGRGLDPNRSANFNTRQNGYDISADVLGYPESYYSPPAEALREIQVLRGAASLQYGTQFGGLVNFRFHRPEPNRKLAWTSRQTVGSNNLFTSFNSLSGTVGDFSYYTYYHYKTGDGFRPNSGFDAHNAFAHLGYRLSEKTKLSGEFTYLRYLAQQPGGLTDAQFYADPTQSNRTRNWFQVDWRLWQAQLEHEFSPQTRLSWQFFGLDAERNAVGFRTNRVSQVDDPSAPRDLLLGTFRNWGSEARLLHRYRLRGEDAIALVGAKFYRSRNRAVQGAGTAAADADFTLANDRFPAFPAQSSFVFPNQNLALFGEHIFYLNERLSITPGIRYEYLRTESSGTFRAIDFDLAGNPIRDETFADDRTFERNRVLLGAGVSYRPKPTLEGYANVSQNYRSVTFNDIRTVNPSFQIDPNITDENGFTADLGVRGRTGKWRFDLSGFSLLYNDRLGEVLRAQTRVNADGTTVETGRIIRFRGNIGQALIYGFEGLLDWSILTASEDRPRRLNAFVNLALTGSEYLESEIAGVAGNRVEFIPLVNLKTGVTFGWRDLLGSMQFTYLGEQFTDASNAPQDRNDNQSGIVGTIPGYAVADVSLSYKWRFLKLEAGVNNLFDRSYFTRRATGYPGPGILPSLPRTGYAGLVLNF